MPFSFDDMATKVEATLSSSQNGGSINDLDAYAKVKRAEVREENSRQEEDLGRILHRTKEQLQRWAFGIIRLYEAEEDDVTSQEEGIKTHEEKPMHADLTADISSMKTELLTLQKGLYLRVHSQKAFILRLESRLDCLAGRVDLLTTSLGTVDDHTQYIAYSFKRIDELEARMEATASKIADKINKCIAALTENVGTIKQLAKRVEKQEGIAAMHANTIEDNGTYIGHQHNAIDAIYEKIGHNGRDIAGNKDAIGKLTDYLNGLVTRLNSHNTRTHPAASVPSANIEGVQTEAEIDHSPSIVDCTAAKDVKSAPLNESAFTAQADKAAIERLNERVSDLATCAAKLDTRVTWFARALNEHEFDDIFISPDSPSSCSEQYDISS
ncbi:MAG: hypothetical protein M1819_001089 [Sarea resinae]|nr:MAG: hypothetical protein M1819_001089 [Sarea resinae]